MADPTTPQPGTNLTERAQAIQAAVDKHLERYRDQAKASSGSTLDVLATPHVQAGREILVAGCPCCTTIAALDGEGKHQCRRCGQWLNYHKK